MFWLAAGFATLAGLLAAGAMTVALGVPDSALTWIWPAGAFAFCGWLAFKFLAMGINTSRALEPSPDPVHESRAQKMESGGRMAGAALGAGARTLLRRRPRGRTDGSSNPPAPAPAPVAQTAPTPTARTTPDADATTAAETPEPPTPEPHPTLTPPARVPPPSAPLAKEPQTEVTADKAARVLGSMVGRRLADRKKPNQ